MSVDNLAIKLLVISSLLSCAGAQTVLGFGFKRTPKDEEKSSLAGVQIPEKDLSEAKLTGAELTIPESARRPSGSTSENPKNAYPAKYAPESVNATPEPVVPNRRYQQGKMDKIGTMAQPLVLKGQIHYAISHGTPVKLKLASVPVHGLSVCPKDIDGNLPPAQLNQRISAKTTEDLYVDSNRVLPEGTVFYGRVSRIIPPRRVNRPGSLELSFDSFKLPDGRRFAFKAAANNLKPSTMGTKLHGAGIIAGHAAGGAIVGVLVAYEVFGWQGTASMHGYNIAGGAALGAVAGATYSIMKHGRPAVLEPGDDLNMTIASDLLMPAAVERAAKSTNENPYVEIEVLKSKVSRDGLNGYLLSLNTRITNNSDDRLNSIDLYLEDSNNNRFPVSSDSRFDSEELFTIEPHSIKTIKFSFQVEYPKLHRKLVWLEHHSNKIITMQKLL